MNFFITFFHAQLHKYTISWNVCLYFIYGSFQ